MQYGAVFLHFAQSTSVTAIGILRSVRVRQHPMRIKQHNKQALDTRRAFEPTPNDVSLAGWRAQTTTLPHEQRFAPARGGGGCGTATHVQYGHGVKSSSSSVLFGRRTSASILRFTVGSIDARYSGRMSICARTA